MGDQNLGVVLRPAWDALAGPQAMDELEDGGLLFWGSGPHPCPCVQPRLPPAPFRMVWIPIPTPMAVLPRDLRGGKRLDAPRLRLARPGASHAIDNEYYRDTIRARSLEDRKPDDLVVFYQGGYARISRLC